MTDATVFDLALAKLSIGEYAPIRSEYYMAVAGTIREYLYTDGANTLQYTQRFRAFISQYFPLAFEQGYIDGGSEMPAEPDDADWLSSRIDNERTFAAMLFQQLKELKTLAKEEGREVFDGVPEKHADGYVKTLDAVYSEAKVRGAKNQMLTFGGRSGRESCPDCQKLMGKRHRAKWWKAKGLIPGIPGNTNFECGGWQCEHILFNDKGEVFNV